MAIKQERLTLQNISAAQTAIPLNDVAMTRALLLDVTVNLGATADGALTWTDVIASMALAFRNIRLQYGSDQPFDIDGQTLFYYNYLKSQNIPYHLLLTSGTVGAPNLQIMSLILDQSLINNAKPHAGMLDPRKALSLLFIPAVGLDVASNAGIVLTNLTVEITQCYDLAFGQPDFTPTIKWLSLFSQVLTASVTKQQVPITPNVGNKLHSVFMIVGAGSQGKVVPADGLDRVTLNLGGLKMYDDVKARNLKNFFSQTHKPNEGNGSAYQGNAAVATTYYGLPGLYNVDAAYFEDPVQATQDLPISSSGNNKLFLDTLAGGTFVVAAVESYERISSLHGGQAVTPKK